MKKLEYLIIILTGIIILSSCSPMSKESYLNDYDIQAIENLQKQLSQIQQKNKVLQDTLVTKPPVKESKPFPTSVLLAGIALLLIVGGITGYFIFYKPYAIDRDAPRFYTFAKNTFLRSSQEAGVDYNKLGTIPYGSELILYNKGYEWSDVKWKDPKTGKALKGYISSDYILSGGDFKILNSLWGDNESKKIINTAKCRIALLNYFKEKGGTHGWRVFSKAEDIKPNTSYYARIVNKNSKFTDFAVIIKNIDTQERKCLLFSFDDDEAPHLIYEEAAPFTGDITGIVWDNYGYTYNVSYN
ncbi:SH3 domain-containing protein [Bacteroidales bacterium OttesenSCG-928-L03]|nr:SH3 domain-containing protein [Bacteroidales bacterium OttesenSCG-928-L03]